MQISINIGGQIRSYGPYAGRGSQKPKIDQLIAAFAAKSLKIEFYNGFIKRKGKPQAAKAGHEAGDLITGGAGNGQDKGKHRRSPEFHGKRRRILLHQQFGETIGSVSKGSDHLVMLLIGLISRTGDKADTGRIRQIIDSSF